MARNINRVVITGNLTADPEMRSTSGGTSICRLRVAVNGSEKDSSGQWVDKPNYFTVTVFGAQGENCSTYLSKGRPVAIEGRLRWHEWESDSGKRESVEIVADNVQFLGSRDDGGEGGGQGRSFEPRGGELKPDPVPAAFGPSGGDDDIPF
jgi:single-strand DNA-binding protein